MRHRAGDVRFWSAVVVPAWCVLLAVVIGLPWFRGGYLLAYDMVWVPDLDLGRADLWGLGTALPRAVPSDVVVALLAVPFDPQLVQRLVLLGVVVAAGTAGARLVPDLGLPARLAAATLACWNPFVAERLALGQWALLVGYAGLLWLVVQLRSERQMTTIVLALAATAMTPVSGLMGLLVVLVVGWRQKVGGVVLLAVVLNLPWVVAALLRRNALAPDPAAVGLFELQPEGVLGRLGAALSLGGIWNTDVVPTSRTLLVVALLVVLTWVVIGLGLVDAVRRGREELVGPALVAAVGLLVALAGWLAPDALAAGIEVFSPLALLRDGTRWLALLVPLYVIGLAHGVQWLARRAPSPATATAAGVLVVVLPIAALPDLALGVGGRLTPVQYPAAWAEARELVAEDDGPGDVVSLPFSAYRAPAWNEDRPVLDPAGRYFDRLTVVNDELVVSGTTIGGEDARAARVADALRGEDPPAALARQGIGFVVLDTTAPEAEQALEQVDGLEELGEPGAELRVYVVPDARDRSVDQEERVYMVAAWGLAGLVVLGGILGALRRAWTFEGRREPTDRPV